jgi:hypothetical protein
LSPPARELKTAARSPGEQEQPRARDHPVDGVKAAAMPLPIHQLEECSHDDLVAQASSITPGTSVPIVLLRAGSRQTVSVN